MKLSDLIRVLLIEYFDIAILNEGGLVKETKRYDWKDARKLFGEFKVYSVAIHNEIEESYKIVNIAYVEIKQE